MQGYQASRMPAEQKMKEQQQAELTQQLQHGNYKAGAENQYLPGKLQNEEQLRDIDLRFAEPNAQAELQKSLLGNENQQMKNEIMKKYGMSEAQADLLLKQAQTNKYNEDAKYAGQSHLTPTQKDALATYGSLNSPESREYQRRALGVMPAPTNERGEELPLPPSAVKLQGFGEGVKRSYTDRMDKNIERGEAAKVANGYLDEIEQIIDKYPHAYKELSYIMAHPEDTGRLARFVDATRDEGLKTALDLMQKYSSSLVIAQTETSNQRATNAFRTLISQTKPSSGMTPSAVKNVIKNMRHSNDPLVNYSDKAAPFSGYAYIPYQAKNFQNKGDEPSIEGAISANGNGANNQSEMVTIKNSKTGETKTVTREEAKKIGAIK
jgi:hypothetical protein